MEHCSADRHGVINERERILKFFQDPLFVLLWRTNPTRPDTKKLGFGRSSIIWQLSDKRLILHFLSSCALIKRAFFQSKFKSSLMSQELWRRKKVFFFQQKKDLFIHIHICSHVLNYLSKGTTHFDRDENGGKYMEDEQWIYISSQEKNPKRNGMKIFGEGE